MKAKKIRRETWRTTDAEERAKRQERAKVEPMKVRTVDAPDGFGLYEVSHPAADRRTATYHVEIRSLDAPVNTCDCPDFAKSGLGTCKHIERALKTAARKCGSRRTSSTAECPNVERMSVITTGVQENKSIGKAIVVGRGVDKEKIARQIADTQGVALPNEAIETIDPETWQLMKRLEKMGVIQFNAEFLQDVVVRTAPDVAQVEAQKRRLKAEQAFADVTRQLDMGDLLVKGGFVAEAQGAYRKAVALAAAVASYAHGSGELDAAIEPVTLEDLVRVRDELRLPPEETLILQLAVQGLDLPNAAASARNFCAHCREMLK